jgi:hypothetical protein
MGTHEAPPRCSPSAAKCGNAGTSLKPERIWTHRGVPEWWAAKAGAVYDDYVRRWQRGDVGITSKLDGSAPESGRGGRADRSSRWMCELSYLYMVFPRRHPPLRCRSTELP